MVDVKDRTRASRRDLDVLSAALFRPEEFEPAEYSPRLISNGVSAGPTSSIPRFACAKPIVVNVRGGRRIVGGHRRLKAFQALDARPALCIMVNCGFAEEKLPNLTLKARESLAEYRDKKHGAAEATGATGRQFLLARRAFRKTDDLDE
jgi:hypothetical protein